MSFTRNECYRARCNQSIHSRSIGQVQVVFVVPQRAHRHNTVVLLMHGKAQGSQSRLPAYARQYFVQQGAMLQQWDAKPDIQLNKELKQKSRTHLLMTNASGFPELHSLAIYVFVCTMGGWRQLGP